MPSLEVDITPVDLDKKLEMAFYISAIIISANERGVKCRVTSTGALVEGNKDTILEILTDIDEYSFSKMINKLCIKLDFDESQIAPNTQSEIRKKKKQILNESF